jgi:hypothetical protein
VGSKQVCGNGCDQGKYGRSSAHDSQGLTVFACRSERLRQLHAPDRRPRRQKRRESTRYDADIGKQSAARRSPTGVIGDMAAFFADPLEEDIYRFCIVLSIHLTPRAEIRYLSPAAWTAILHLEIRKNPGRAEISR